MQRLTPPFGAIVQHYGGPARDNAGCRYIIELRKLITVEPDNWNRRRSINGSSRLLETTHCSVPLDDILDLRAYSGVCQDRSVEAGRPGLWVEGCGQMQVRQIKWAIFHYGTICISTLLEPALLFAHFIAA
ncbi:hypothetical protein J6590_058087 [Homalodisca vitripennis]|nr:hypothetical protein J6590_058087 [Homalodisca vitripennis]